MRIKILSCIFFLLYAPLVFGDVDITPKELAENYGIVPINLKPVGLSSNGDFYVGCEYVKDIKYREKGLVWAIRIFRFNKTKDKLDKVDTIYLPITELRGINFLSDQENELIALGNYGSKILKIDLVNLKVDTVFEYKKGEPGFRSENLMNTQDGKGFLLGYFYDNNRRWLGDCVADLIPGQKGMDMFKKRYDYEAFKKKLDGKLSSYFFINPSLAYLVLNRKDCQALVVYKDDKVTELDKFEVYGSMAATSNRVVYVARYKSNVRKGYIRDINTGKVWEIPLDRPLHYPFMSKKGDMIILCETDFNKRKMAIYYARETDGFKLKKQAENLEIGVIKISGDGNFYMFWDNFFGFKLRKI